MVDKVHRQSEKIDLLLYRLKGRIQKKDKTRFIKLGHCIQQILVSL